MGELQKSEKGSEKGYHEKMKELRMRIVKKIREQGGTSCKLFWTDVRGRREGWEEKMKKEGWWRVKTKCWK